MTSISSLSSTSQAATSLVKSVSALDTNGDGVVSAAELAAAQGTGSDEDAADSSTEASAAAKLTSLLTNLSLDGAESGPGAAQGHGPGGPPPAGGPPPGAPPPGGKPPAGGAPGQDDGAQTQGGTSSSDTANTLLASILEQYQAN